LQVGASALGFGEELLVGGFAKIVERCWWLVGDHVVVKDAVHWFANGLEISSGFELILLMGLLYCYLSVSFRNYSFVLFQSIILFIPNH
jgi:hypothetical protein